MIRAEFAAPATMRCGAPGSPRAPSSLHCLTTSRARFLVVVSRAAGARRTRGRYKRAPAPPTIACPEHYLRAASPDVCQHQTRSALREKAVSRNELAKTTGSATQSDWDRGQGYGFTTCTEFHGPTRRPTYGLPFVSSPPTALRPARGGVEPAAATLASSDENVTRAPANPGSLPSPRSIQTPRRPFTHRHASGDVGG